MLNEWKRDIVSTASTSQILSLSRVQGLARVGPAWSPYREVCPGKHKRLRGTWFIGFPCYPEVEHSYETFHKPKCHQAEKQLSFIYMKTMLSVPKPKKITSLRLFWYLKTHLANRCVQWIEIKHRCSETRFKAAEAWSWAAECSSGEGAWGRHSRCWGALYFYKGLLPNKCRMLFFPFTSRWKSSLDFFQLVKIGTNVDLLYKSEVAYCELWKSNNTCIFLLK